MKRSSLANILLTGTVIFYLKTLLFPKPQLGKVEYRFAKLLASRSGGLCKQNWLLSGFETLPAR